MKKKLSQFRGLAVITALTFIGSSYSLTAQTVQTYNFTGAIQTFTVPLSCVDKVTIDARGAQGGGDNGGGGLGARMVAEYTVTPGQVLYIAVGEMGQLQSGGQSQNSSGGGGGSFVYTAGPNLLVAAGGGGGLCNYSGSTPPTAAVGGTTGTTGGSGDGPPFGSGTNGAGGTGGNGGVGGLLNGNYDSGGGAGWLTPGVSAYGGTSFPTFNGGPGYCGGGGGGCGGRGGYGGGGGGGNDYGGGGGGGGYSGGGGGIDATHGGGGASFSSGTNQSNTSGYQSGNGLVIISYGTNANGVALSASNNGNICPGTSVILTASNVLSYTWAPGGSNATSIQVSPNVNTTYTVSGFNSQGCQSNAYITVTVNPSPIISVVSSKSLVCLGDTALLTASGADTYTWTGGPSTFSYVISPNTNVNTTYSVVGTSTAGCVNSNFITPLVDPLVLSTSGNTTICMGKSATLLANGANPGTYGWTNNSTGNTTPFQSTIVSPTVTTVYTASGIDANNCTISEVISVSVNPNPTVTASTTKTVVCKGQQVVLTGGGATSYSWSTGATTQTAGVVPNINTTFVYTVTGTDANGCSSSTVIAIRAELCTGINENGALVNSVVIYPNPGTGLFLFETLNTGPNRSIKIFSASGALIKTLDVVSQKTEIDIQRESSGIYFVHFLEGDVDVSVTKIIKE